MKTWEEIRDEVAGMLADGQPLEDIISKLEQRKNEMAKAELIAVFDELKKPKPLTNEEWFNGLSTTEKAKWFCDHITCSDGCHFYKQCLNEDMGRKLWQKWLLEEHREM